MKKYVWMMLGAAALVAGCGSTVKLDDVPVESRVGTTVGQGTPGGASAAGTTQSSVAPVAADGVANLAPGPQGTGRIVYFDYDSFVIKPEFQALIDSHARYIKANGGRRVAIEGHTDERGGREYNLALGQKRAEAVRRALVLLGVADNQIEAVSFGKEKPAEAGSDEAAFAKNRRAEIAYR
jgi:peptidoglycan-associated lipoprotein